jgi:cell division septum initiation protein DivIVA
VSQIEVIWAPAESYSMTERASAIAQTKGVISRYQQATEIWGMDPAQADRNMSELTDDFVIDQQYGLAKIEASTAPANVSAGT